MCTCFIRNGKDVICGFNFDVDESVWNYKIYKKKDMFYIGIKFGSRIYKVHGVNKNGNFGNLPYMNDLTKGIFAIGKKYQRLDLLNERFISGKYSLSEVESIAQQKEIVNIPNCSMHSLITDSTGRMMIIEPGNGYRIENGKYCVITNFPLLEKILDLSSPFYGKDRYDKANEILASSNDDFSIQDGLKLLFETRQEGKWATRVSFVYSKKENAVYYVLNNDFKNVKKHQFI